VKAPWRAADLEDEERPLQRSNNGTSTPRIFGHMRTNAAFASNTPPEKVWAAVGIALAVVAFLLDIAFHLSWAPWLFIPALTTHRDAQTAIVHSLEPHTRVSPA